MIGDTCQELYLLIELELDQNAITAGKRTQLQKLVSPGYREDLDSGGFFASVALPILFLVTVVLIMYMEVITHGLLFQLQRLPLLHEQSTNLVKSVRRPIGHTTAGGGGNARIRTTREHQELRHHSTGKYTHNTFLRKTNFFTSQDMLSCVFETSQKLS